MKQSALGADISGRSRLTTLKPASAVAIVRWVNHLLSSTEILSAYRGRATSIKKPLRFRFTTAKKSCRVFESAGIKIA